MTNFIPHKTTLTTWSNGHGVALLVFSLLLTIFSWPVEFLALFGAFSFAILIWLSGFRSVAQFGSANLVTLARLMLILLLPFVSDESGVVVISIALVVLCLDGIDGWIARRHGLATEFGEYFDKESDAFFMLVLCCLLVMGGRLGVWIMLPGMLRYLFVCFLLIVKPPALKERQTVKGKVIYIFTMLTLIASFSPYNQFYRPAAAAITLLLAYSFFESIRLMYLAPGQEDAA